MKRMKHPEHGFHHAYTPQEEATMRENGWVDDDTEGKKKPFPEPDDELVDVPVEEGEVFKPRRGRPPKVRE
jgi:hypothetical protein